jgi:predicted TIM-barrel fold metal-dependent hydrolase
MERLAVCHNVNSKLSAFGTFIHRNDPGHIADMVGQTIEIFGAGRCCFGSNFPIEKLWTSYGGIIAAFTDAAHDLEEEDQRAIFHDTAARIYRL